MRLVSIALALIFPTLAAVGATGAAAEPPAVVTPVSHDRGLEIGGGVVAGFGTPAGTVALEATVAPLPWLVIAGDVGTNHDGTQAALSARARSPGDVGLYAGAGLAGGHFEAWHDDDFDPPMLLGAGRALWTTFELGVELDSDHVSFRGFAGIKVLDNTICRTSPDSNDPCSPGGYAGVALDVH